MLKICFSYGTFETSTNFPNRGVVYICLDLIGQRLSSDLMALVCGVYYEFVTFPLVFWVRCGT